MRCNHSMPTIDICATHHKPETKNFKKQHLCLFVQTLRQVTETFNR